MKLKLFTSTEYSTCSGVDENDICKDICGRVWSNHNGKGWQGKDGNEVLTSGKYSALYTQKLNQIFLCMLNDNIFCQEPFQSRHNVTLSSLVLKIYRLIVFNRSGFDAEIMRKICLIVQ